MTVTLYSKPQCPLCEEAEEVIECVRARRPFEVVKRNILNDATDYDRYKHDIPVVFVGDCEVARHRVSDEQLDDALALGEVAVVVMAKLPEPGRVKTRLTPALSAGQAASVHREFLCHLVGRLADMPWGKLIVSHDPPDARDAVCKILGREIDCQPQLSGDLGARLAAAAHAARQSCPNVMFLGADIPDVPLASIRRIAHLLRSHELVIAPANDGGFWSVALGASVDTPGLLKNIEWSTGRECAQTLQQARALGYNVALADRWDDVDHPDDLRRLLNRLRRSAEPDDQALLQRLSRIWPHGVAP